MIHTSVPLISHSDRGVRHRFRALLTLLTIFAIMLAGAGHAQAWTNLGSGGQPGTFYVPQIIGSHLSIAAGTSYTFTPVIGNMPLDVARSTATTGQQQVVITFIVKRWNGSSWTNLSTSSVSGVLGAGVNTTRLPTWSTYPTRSGYYFVSAIVTWYSGTSLLGYVSVTWTSSGDYVCKTIVAPCQAGAGWLYLG
jgi:uncharacterized membrane protein HdeD (DUF308 family)